jgi:hypothetical protein
MRHLTFAAAVLVVGIATASTAAADPTETPAPAPSTAATPDPSTPATPAPSSTAASSESSPASPSESAPASPAPSESAPASPAPSGSSGTPAGAHQVTYTVTTTSDLTANIYYVVGDPPNQAAANKPEFMPMARTQVGPGAPWSIQANLNDPTQWAFVSASGGLRVNPEFHCEIAVDGKVVVSQQGGSGVQCALRPW